MENQLRVFLQNNYKLVGKIIAPNYLTLGKKKIRKYSLDLNVYRNLHYQTLNKLKGLYASQLSNQISALPQLSRILLVYELYPARLCDTSNFCSVHSKFFLDALVGAKKLVDDNYHYVADEIYTFGSKSNNPRTEIFIYEDCL